MVPGYCMMVTIALVIQLPSGAVVVLAVLTLSPAGVPSALRFMPGLLDAVKSAVSREAAQLFDKLMFVADKVRCTSEALVFSRMCCIEAVKTTTCAMQAGRMLLVQLL
jgi:hypothetical protein